MTEQKRHPQRYCNGGPNGKAWCGKAATVVCTERLTAGRPLQWFACDEKEHQEDASVEPIEQWFERHGPDGE